MLRRAFTPARLFLQFLLLVAMGIWMLAAPQQALTTVIQLMWGWLLLSGVLLLVQGLVQRKRRDELLKGVLLTSFAVVVGLWPLRVASSISTVMGLWIALNALFKLIFAVQLWHDHQRGVLSNLLMGLLHGLFAAAVLTAPLQAVLPLTVLLGIYLMIYGVMALIDFFRELLGTDVKGKRIRQRIRVAPPALLTALIPLGLLQALDDPDEEAEVTRWTRRETNDDRAHADLEIFLHLSRSTAFGLGHVDIALGDRVLSYGCYDLASNRLFGLLSDGVLVEADRDRYIPFCLNHERKKLIAFGVTLTPDQRLRVTAAAEALLHDSELWQPPEGTVQADFAAQAGAIFHKVRSGPFRTYNALKTNCVALADQLCGASGLDLMSVQGIVTPGTYFAFLDRQFLRKNSIVISRTVYR